MLYDLFTLVFFFRNGGRLEKYRLFWTIAGASFAAVLTESFCSLHVAAVYPCMYVRSLASVFDLLSRSHVNMTPRLKPNIPAFLRTARAVTRIINSTAAAKKFCSLLFHVNHGVFCLICYFVLTQQPFAEEFRWFSLAQKVLNSNTFYDKSIIVCTECAEYDVVH